MSVTLPFVFHNYTDPSTYTLPLFRWRRLRERETSVLHSFSWGTSSPAKPQPLTITLPADFLLDQVWVVSLFASHTLNQFQYQSSQCLGYAVVMLASTAQTRPVLVLSSGLDVREPTFALEFSCLPAMSPMATLARPLSSAQFVSNHALEVIRDLRREETSRKVWPRQELQTITDVFESRETQIWPGEWMHHLYTPRYQKEAVYTMDHVRFYQQMVRMARLDLHDQVKDSHTRRYQVEFMNQVLGRVARCYVYGNDQVEKASHFRPPEPEFSKESSNSWRLTRFVDLRLSSRRADKQESDVLQTTGDQLMLIRTCPVSLLATMQADCEDVTHDNALTHMHLKQLLLQKNPVLEFPERRELEPLLKWTTVVCICTALHNLNLTLDDRRSYLSGKDDEKGTLQNSYGAHSLSVSFPTELLHELVRRGRRDQFHVAVPAKTRADSKEDLAVALLESVDMCPGYMEPDADESWESPQLSRLHHLLCQYKCPHRVMWQIMQSHHRIQYASTYGFAVAIYSADVVDGEEIGQVFWHQTRSKQTGMSIQEMMNAPLLWNTTEWCLRKWVSFKPPADLKLSPYVCEELRGACYTLSANKLVPEVDWSASATLPPGIVWVYTRKLDWEKWGSDFWKWWQQQMHSTFHIYQWNGHTQQVERLMQSSHVQTLWTYEHQPILRLGFHFPS